MSHIVPLFRVFTSCFLVLLSLPAAALAQVVLSEIHYNPPEGGELQFVEIHNAGAAEVSLTGWSLAEGVLFTFPEGTKIAPGGYLAIGKSRDALRALFPDPPDASLLGDFAGSLANEGEKVALLDAQAKLVDAVAYSDALPWDFLADGYGASLERVCMTAPSSLPENWHASPVPGDEARSGGSPGLANHTTLCPPAFPARPRVYISEVMYHPVQERSLEESHEFIEIHSEETSRLSLEGWRLAGGIDFVFPKEAAIEPLGYVVVAKNPLKLAAVAEYGLEAASLLGPYERELDNGGDKIALLGPGGQGIDSLDYDDDAPWPAGADALGAQEEWLAPELLPLETHQYRGISLERVSYSVPSGELANWAPSPLDGATPGKPNASARAEPDPVVQDTLVRAVGSNADLIRADEQVLVQARIGPKAPSGPVELEHFVDLIMTPGEEPVEKTPMFDDGAGGGDLIPGDGIYTATLPGRAVNTVVRYRILADLGAGPVRLSPRPSDPNAWNAYFTSPVIETETRVYQVFVSLADWGKMWSGIQGGRVTGCKESATWDAKYPAVFIHEGRVFDAFVRYQGSRWNRTNGPNINTWPFPRPTGGPNPLRALSWRIALPRYNQLEGLSVITLNKLTQGCPGYNAGVGYRLFEEAGVPGSKTRFIRFHVNGGYYHYMIELEHPDENMVRRFYREQAEKHPELPREKVGHLFKSAGCNCDEGPYGWGDERVLNPSCGFTKEQRYAATYDRKTNPWDSYSELAKLMDDLAAARAGGEDAIRELFLERFDYDLFLNYICIMNWSVPFDDMFQNHFLYQRLSDGKWIVFPWDLDQNFGEWKPAAASIYMGEQGDPDNRSGWWNYMKDAFLKAFRQEYDDRLLLLNNTILHPDNVARLVDEVTAKANPAEAQKAPAGLQCSFPGRAATFKQFAVQRQGIVNTKIAGVALDAGGPQAVYAGTTVQFDARNSKPDPSPDVTYVWDNGMTGDYPTFKYEAPGEYTVTLTVTVRGIEFKDSVVITVLAKPEKAFLEASGVLVLEAESFHENDRHGAANTWWEADTVQAGYSGPSYMEAKQSARQTFLQKYAGIAPELRYAVLFQTAGTYRVWLRAFSATTQADGAYVGLNGAERNARFAQQFVVDPSQYLWSGDTRSAGPQLLEVPQPGLYLFSIWLRESGQIIDKVILTQDQAFTPDGAGPAESAQGAVGGPRSFVRGDADSNGRLAITDPIVLLRHLFQGGAAPYCADAADADDSGKLDLTDAVRVLEYLFREGPQPPPPFPGPGLDETADDLGCGS